MKNAAIRISIVCLWLSACASQASIPWRKPGASEEVVRIAYESCRRQSNDEVRQIMSRDLNALTDNPASAAPAGTSGSLEEFQRDRLAEKERRFRDEAIDNCMIKKGFER